MSGLKRGLKISAWVAVFIVAVVYLQRYGIAPLQSAVNDMGIWAPLGLFLLRGVSIIPVSYTHLTLPTNREV